MKFDILCTQNSEDGAKIRKFVYDNMTSEIFDENNNPIFKQPEKKKYSKSRPAHKLSRDNPGIKTSNIKILKIQLGLTCNYSCEYCSQRFVPNADETSHKHIDKFMKNLDIWLHSVPEKIEFWGGEPFVYWKTLKPLVAALRLKFPDVRFTTITNGSLLTPEINQWIIDNNIGICISHDGPGQSVRGPDPLQDPESREAIEDLWWKRNGTFSFNSMLHKENMDRQKIAEFFIERFGPDVKIGEGSFIDAYDEGGLKNSHCTTEEFYAFRRLTMSQLREGSINNFVITGIRLNDWMTSFRDFRPADVLGQKCGMDRPDILAVDLRGNVLTCQNVSAVSTKDNGQSHLLGHVSNMEKVRLDTSTHWSHREECVKCPLLQACKGSCMFLDDEKFKISCNSAYSDHLPFFCAAFEMVTGCLPFAIIAEDKSLPEERMDLWGPASKKYDIPKTREFSDV